MDVAVKKQMSTAGYIERFWENLCKVGKEKMTRSYLDTRLGLLETYWSRFLNAHDDLLALEKVEASDYMKQDVYMTTEDNYVATKSRIVSFLKADRASESTGSGETSAVIKQIQLPKINLPTFNGDQLAWEGFRDLFKALVHDVVGLAPTQKLQYLKASLTGEAAAVVASIEISSDGYALAWDELVARYDNRRVLLATHMRALLSSSPLSKPSAAEINRLISVVNQALCSFRSLGRPVKYWDDWFVHILVEKLDSSTRLLWESSQISSREFSTYAELKEFLLTRARALDASTPREAQPTASSTKSKRGKDEVSAHTISAGGVEKGTPCPLCKERHALRSCFKFKAYPAEQRRDQVRKKKACFNCLGQGHTVSNCPSTNRCRHCQEKHHSLLHLEGSETPSLPTATPTSNENSSTPERAGVPGESAKVAALSSSTSGTVLLATATVSLIGDSGRAMTVRALLDSGSEASFVSERVAQQLKLPRRRINITVSGLQGVTTGTARHAVTLMVGTKRSPSVRIALPRALVLPKLTALTPGKQITRGVWSHLQGLEFADPDFARPATVDAILGADIFGMLLEGGVRRGLPGEPVAHSTVFGWVLMGALADDPSPTSVASHHVSALSDLQQDLCRFWELEELADERLLTPEEMRCERLFAETHTRDAEGRYMVRLPRRENPSTELGTSRRGALQMLLSTERRLERETALKANYAEFLSSYLSLGHMEPVPERERAAAATYYMPHHAVFKKTDPGGKIRVVFNASFRTSTGVSLNDVLLPGPKLQADLWLILTRWRLHQFAFTTDIVKMFRQIRVHPDDTNLQRILWRADPSAEVQDFRLTTVTYGTASAPYLATRTLLQLAQDEGLSYPLGAAVIRANTYVDDVLAGASTLEEAQEIRQQTVNLLEAGGFRLSKWAGSNLALCPDGDQEERLFSATEGVGTLGVIWAPAEDSLRLRAIPALTSTRGPSKRTVLSDVARLFDPAGWAAPVLIGAKVFLQDLWLAGLDWDEALPPTLQTRWLRFASSLSDLDRLSIPRWTGISSHLELHGFSDASERAYAAVVYVRGTGPSGVWCSSLLVAKTKVAPAKPVSIPRLELCGALLAARLLQRTATGLGLAASDLYAWTDAKVVLAWLRGHPSRWKPFIANRVAAVQELVPADRWKHVPTKENPADPATRGITPAELSEFRLWWRGPGWLEGPADSWPNEAPVDREEGEERRIFAVVTAAQDQENELLVRFSSFSRLIRVTAYCARFLRDEPRPGTALLSAGELERCRLRWLRIAQRLDYAREIEALSRGEPVPRRSPLRALRPILGPDGLIRVGGRLEHSPLTFEEKHPVILAKGNHLSLLLARDAHHRTLHGGPQLTRSVLGRRYWIVHANSLIRSVVHACVKCARFRGATAQQQMGQLPVDRVRAARPFWSAGVDYAGPIQLRASKGRGIKSFKGYVCLFVCMATKAVHLEAVSDLTTASFIAAFHRFVARRGHCARLASDNGTNFRGADRELREMFNAAAEFYKDCRAQLATDGTEWSFIPPSAPHFGGLWEAGVKSTKHHLRRVLGDHLLTYEELSTLLCRVEACLNSRPLYPMSAEAADLAALTPGHLLLGEAPINVPEPPYNSGGAGQPKLRWQLVATMRDHFWSRWSKEYLQHLQQLGKWRDRSANLQPGTIVLLKDELLPPGKWALGRIREARPGADGLVRVVTVDTATSRLTRPITKICPLPDLKDD